MKKVCDQITTTTHSRFQIFNLILLIKKTTTPKQTQKRKYIHMPRGWLPCSITQFQIAKLIFHLTQFERVWCELQLFCAGISSFTSKIAVQLCYSGSQDAQVSSLHLGYLAVNVEYYTCNEMRKLSYSDYMARENGCLDRQVVRQTVSSNAGK